MLGILVVVYLLCRFLVRSQFGLALAGLRENEQRIAFFGYQVQHLKAIIFRLRRRHRRARRQSLRLSRGFVWPNMLGVVMSTQVVLYVLFGGSGTLIGAVIGAVVDRGRQLLAVGQLPGDLADHPRRAVAAGHPVPPAGLISLVLGERERVGSFGAAKPAEGRIMPLLEARGIVKIFGKLTALDGAALTVAENEFHGLIGPNGSGKSTLMKCIAGAEMPTAGHGALRRPRHHRASPAERARAGMSLKFQITSVLPALTLYDNILLALQAQILACSTWCSRAPAAPCTIRSCRC